MTDELKPIHITRLKMFVRELLLKSWNDGCCTDDGDIQDLAIKHKIVCKRYAPKEWRDEYEKDHWYTLPKWLK